MTSNDHMYLIYPGMTNFVEVEITEPAREAGYCYVRDVSTDAVSKVSVSRLVDHATAQARTRTETITENHSDWVNGPWISTTTTRTVTVV